MRSVRSTAFQSEARSRAQFASGVSGNCVGRMISLWATSWRAVWGFAGAEVVDAFAGAVGGGSGYAGAV
jgi:hypothetical protein